MTALLRAAIHGVLTLDIASCFTQGTGVAFDADVAVLVLVHDVTVHLQLLTLSSSMYMYTYMHVLECATYAIQERINSVIHWLSYRSAVCARGLTLRISVRPCQEAAADAVIDTHLDENLAAEFVGRRQLLTLVVERLRVQLVAQ